jgi:hypothetical protein
MSCLEHQINICLATRVLSIEEFLAGKDVFRATSAGRIPTAHPTQVISSSKEGDDISEILETRYIQVLKNYHISYTDISFRAIRRKSGLRTEAMDTLIIQTTDTDVTNWVIACSEILELFVDAGFDKTEVNVEIWNRERMYQDVSRCLPNDALVVGAMEDVAPRVIKEVQKNLSDSWTSVAYHSRGPKSASLSVMKPTVIVFVEPGTRLMFERIEVLILPLLHST